MIFIRHLLLLGGQFCIRSMLMKHSAEQLYVDALSGSEAKPQGSESDKGMTPAE